MVLVSRIPCDPLGKPALSDAQLACFCLSAGARIPGAEGLCSQAQVIDGSRVLTAQGGGEGVQTEHIFAAQGQAAVLEQVNFLRFAGQVASAEDRLNDAPHLEQAAVDLVNIHNALR